MKNSVKRFIKTAAALLLAASLSAGFTGCGSAPDGKQTVYVLMMVENGAFVDMKDGFIQELRDKGYTE
ncbi:MAG: ABC transporter substrate-binding protein, partial [Huintestinicola sp.]